MEERTPTSEKLARALKAANAPTSMIRKAEEGLYDDYKSELAFPIHQLVTDLRKHNLTRLARRAMDGEFDAQTWEADKWAKSPEGREVFRDLIGGQ